MADTGWHSPAGMSDIATIGTLIWQNPDNAKASDDVDTYILGGLDGGVSHWLRAIGFNMGVPAGATINGIYVGMEKQSAADSTKDIYVRIVKNSVIKNTEMKNPNFWATSDTYVYYGGSTNLWGETWTAADINNAGFGVVLSALNYGGRTRGYVDHIMIKVYYTEAPTGTDMELNIADVFKDIDEIKINIGDAWKAVTGIQINIGDVWKTVFSI